MSFACQYPMDFLKILKSLEEFIYEALSWLVLLPRTLLRIVLRPIRMTDYAAQELARADEGRFKAALSPPLLLILCVLVSHFAELALPAHTPDASGTLADALLASEQNLLLYRMIAFGVWALMGAVYVLARVGTPIDRETLRGPFYEQCYLVSPFALGVSLGASLGLSEQSGMLVASGVLMVMAFAWFWGAQFAWIRRAASLPWWHAAVAATLIIVAGSAVNAGVGYVLIAGGDARVEAPVRDRSQAAPAPAGDVPVRPSDKGDGGS